MAVLGTKPPMVAWHCQIRGVRGTLLDSGGLGRRSLVQTGDKQFTPVSRFSKINPVIDDSQDASNIIGRRYCKVIGPENSKHRGTGGQSYLVVGPNSPAFTRLDRGLGLKSGREVCQSYSSIGLNGYRPTGFGRKFISGIGCNARSYSQTPSAERQKAARTSAQRPDIDLGPYSGVSGINASDKVYVAMSGGVDSSTVAALMAARFSNVEGVFMNNWSSQSKCQETSWREVRQICNVLGISCRRIDLEHDYWTDVFEPMLEAYHRGETPNPDLGCNHYIKFGHLISSLQQRDPEFRWLATGHYAGLDPSTRLVRRAQYMPKDQSYYLATVKRAALDHVVFPLAHLSKPRVRELAAELGLPEQVSLKRDSQGLCFVEQQQEVGQRGFRKFLAEYLSPEPGPVVLASDPSRVVGEHKGLWTHTIGQRASIPMPQSSPETRGQWFVVGKDIQRKALLIAPGTNNEMLFTNQVESDDFQWHVDFSGDCLGLCAQYRSLQEPWKVSAVHTLQDKSQTNTLLEANAKHQETNATHKETKSLDEVTPLSSRTIFKFDSLRRAVAPGQYIVAYDRDVVIGAGTISRTTRV